MYGIIIRASSYRMEHNHLSDSTNTFFHLLQVWVVLYLHHDRPTPAEQAYHDHTTRFSRADNGPVYYLDILRNKEAVFKNWLTNTTLASVPIAQVLDTTLHHKMEVTYGPEGRLDYTLFSKDKEIMHVKADGYMGTGGC